MPKQVIELTGIKVEKAKPKDKDYKLFDGKGLFLLIKKNGSKLWRFKYTSPITKKEKLISLGEYPIIELKEARNKALDNKRLIAKGIDPSEERKSEKRNKLLEEKKQFHLIAYQWIEEINIADITRKRKISAFERDIFPFFCKYDKKHKIVSSKPINQIHHSEILQAVKNKQITAPESGRRLLTDCNSLWLYAISNGYTEFNIIANIDRKNSLKKHQTINRPKITDLDILKKLLNSIDNYKGHIITRSALRLLPYVMLRAENLTTLKWEYVNFEKKTLTIPRELMKVKDPNYADFKLPLVDTAIEILNEVKVFTGWNQWIFHGINKNSQPMNRETINKALRLMGFNNATNGTKQTSHSFRGTYRSLVDTYQSEHKAEINIRDSVLDHHRDNKVTKAYNHKADHTEEMRELLNWWESFLERVKNYKESKII